MVDFDFERCAGPAAGLKVGVEPSRDQNRPYRPTYLHLKICQMVGMAHASTNTTCDTKAVVESGSLGANSG